VLAGAAGTHWEGADGVDQAVDALQGNPLGPPSGSPGRPPPARDPEGAGGPGLWPPRGPTFRKDPAAGWLRNRIDPAKVCVLRPARRLPLTRSRHGPAREGPLPAALRATDPPPACRRKQLRRSVRDARGRQARSARPRRTWAHPGDRRRKLVTLTAAGRAAVATAEAIPIRPPSAVSALGASELELLIDLLQRLIDSDESWQSRRRHALQ